MLRPPAVFLALLLLGGCSVIGAHADAPERGDPALAEARARWAEAGLAAYRYELQYSCFCPPEAMGPFAVTVRAGEATADAPEFVVLPTVEALFALVAEAYAQDAATVEVTYDAALGHPLSIYIDYDEMMADEEYRATVSSLEALGN